MPPSRSCRRCLSVRSAAPRNPWCRPPTAPRAVDDRGRAIDQKGVASDLLQASGPVVAAAGQDLDGVVGDLQPDPVAVELDLMDPTLPDGTLAIGEGRAGSMNP